MIKDGINAWFQTTNETRHGKDPPTENRSTPTAGWDMLHGGGWGLYGTVGTKHTYTQSFICTDFEF